MTPRPIPEHREPDRVPKRRLEREPCHDAYGDSREGGVEGALVRKPGGQERHEHCDAPTESPNDDGAQARIAKPVGPIEKRKEKGSPPTSDGPDDNAPTPSPPNGAARDHSNRRPDDDQSASRGKCGLARKSLKPMAPHCLRSTATQNEGREYTRNEANVTP